MNEEQSNNYRAEWEVRDAVPHLPADIQANASRADEASPTLDAMTEFFAHWCTRSYAGYHESVAIWVLSTIAARRVYLPWRTGVWPTMYIMLVSASTTHAKTEAASYGRKIIEACGLDFLLAPDEITPQKLLSNMAGKTLPRNYSTMDAPTKDKLHSKMAFSAQRGWLYDEFGNKLQDIVNARGGTDALFRQLLKKLYDNSKSFEYDTISRGSDSLEMPSLSIIGTATPACLTPITNKGGAVWTDGTFARIAFSVAPKSELKLQSAPNEHCSVPGNIVRALRSWHQRLGIPNVYVTENKEEDPKGGGIRVSKKDTVRKVTDERDPYDIRRDPLPQQAVTMPEAVYRAHEAYYGALAILAQEHGLEEKFRATYGRLADMALRIAMLLASLENNGVMDMRHWARGQQISERWRMDFHELVSQLTTGEASGYSDTESLVISVLSKLGTMATARTISQQGNTALRKLGSPKVREILDELVAVGLIIKTGSGRGALYGLKDVAQK